MVDVYRFPDAPVDRRGSVQIAAERATVRAQIEFWVGELTSEAQRSRARLQAMTTLLERRDGTALPGFELDDEHPVAPSRLLVRKQDADDVKKYLGAAYAPQEVRVPELEDLCVFQDIGAGARRWRSSAALARSVPDGRAVPSYIGSLGAIRKAEGGPEPSGPQNGGTWPMVGTELPDGPLVVVIDNGVSAEQRTDGWLNGLARTDNLDLLDVVPVDAYLDLGAGHGTFTTGVVQQLTSRARLDVRRALDTEGIGDEVEIGRAIVRAASDGAEIINLSLGMITPDDKPPLALETAVRKAIDVASTTHNHHLLLVCAAGNYGNDRPCWPAAFSGIDEFARHVVSVAALRLAYDDDQEVVGAEWSTHAKWVTCSTLGQGVVSTYVMGRESPTSDKLDPDTFGLSSWATWSGTSFAAPQVVGAIVRTMQDGAYKSAREALDFVLQQAEDKMRARYGDPDADGQWSELDGYGTPLRILPV